VRPAPDYRVIRHKESDQATYGRLFDAAGGILAVSLERPWVDVDNNGIRDRGVCRFQHGLYRCFLRKSHKNGGTGKRDYDVWQLEDVPDCDAAQVHRANWSLDLEGCIGVGSGFGDVDWQARWADAKPRELVERYRGRRVAGITGSIAAFEKFMADSLALCARERRDPPFIWIEVVDQLAPPPGSFA
jgi:hypothetical protein